MPNCARGFSWSDSARFKAVRLNNPFTAPRKIDRATTPWVRSEGKTRDGESIRFTQKTDALYAILLAKPNTREISIESLHLKDGTQVQMLGVNGNLSWTANGENLTLTLPNELPGDYAYALKILPQPV